MRFYTISMLTVGKRIERFLHNYERAFGIISLAVWSMDGSVVMADPPGIDREIKLD